MTDRPLVSLIVPAFRADATISRCITSALAQTWPHLEVVLASDDGTDYLELLRRSGVRDPRLRQAKTGGIGEGAVAARNAALAIAEGSVIAQLDADDALALDALDRLVPMALDDGAAVSNTAVFDTEGRLYKRGVALFPLARRFTAHDLLTPRVPFPPVFQRRLLPEGWTATPFAEDVLVNLQLLTVAPDMRVHPDAHYAYHKRLGSMTLGGDAADRADAGYAELLRLLAGRGLRIDPELRRAAAAQFRFDRRLNQLFRRWLRDGRCAHLEHFLDLTDAGRASWVEAEMAALA
ncbi:MAG: glycosyltransferase [Pseudomonadota bacterium]